MYLFFCLDSDYQLVISVDQAGAINQNTPENNSNSVPAFHDSKILSSNGDMYENYKNNCHPTQYQVD